MATRSLSPVFIAKIVIFIAAIAVLLYTFVLTRRDDTDLVEDFATVERGQSDDKIDISSPRIIGETKSGSQFTFEATNVETNAPEAEGRSANAESIKSEVDIAGNDWSIFANTGDADLGAREIVFRGDVNVEIAQGYKLHSEALDVFLDSEAATSDLETRVTGEDVDIISGAFAVEGESGARIVTFSEGVEGVFRVNNERSVNE